MDIIPPMPGQATGPYYDPRTLVIGDSHLNHGFGAWPTNNAWVPSNFVVSGGVATITTTAAHNINNQSKVVLIDTDNCLTCSTLSMSYGQYTVSSVPSTTTFTVPAVLNGTTMADGTYMQRFSCTGSITSNVLTVTAGTVEVGAKITGGTIAANTYIVSANPNGTYNILPSQANVTSTTITSAYTWALIASNYCSDSALIHWVNALSGGPFIATHTFCFVGATSQQHVASLSRLQAQAPKSSYANVWISVGQNASTPGAGMFSQSTLSTAIEAADTEYRNIMQLADALYSTGIVVIQLPPPTVSGFSATAATYARGLMYLRRKLMDTRRPYELKVIDVTGMSMDGQSTTGQMLAAYQPSSSNSHLSNYACYRLSRQLASWSQRLTMNDNTPTIYKPIGRLDDNTSLVTAWTTSQTWTAGQVRRVAHNIYVCTTGGAGATSGTGPSGTGSAIADNAAVWAYNGPATINLSQNGLMAGTGGSNLTSPDKFTTVGAPGGVVTVPDGWVLSNSGVTNMTNAASFSTAGVNVSPVDSGSDVIPGYQWNLTLVFSGAGVFRVNQNCTGRMQPGTWYRMRCTVNGHTADNTVLKYLQLYCNPSGTGGGGNWFVRGMVNGNNALSIPLKNGESYEIQSQPFYYGSDLTIPSDTQTFVEVGSTGAGTVYVGLSNFVFEPVRDPYVAPASA